MRESAVVLCCIVFCSVIRMIELFLSYVGNNYFSLVLKSRARNSYSRTSLLSSDAK